MIIGLISDSHDHVTHIQRAVEVFKEEKCSLVLHAGDYCSPFTVPYFNGLKLKGVFGNNDGDKFLLMKKFMEIEASMEGDFFLWEESGIRLALYHGTHEEITRSLFESGRYDVLVTGHTHERVQEENEHTLHINPGTAHGFDGTASIALLNTQTREVSFIDLDEAV